VLIPLIPDDLLECECLQDQVRKYNLDEDSKVPSEASDDEEDLPDLRDLDGKKDADVGNDSDSASNEDEEPAFVAASQYEGKSVSLLPSMTYDGILTIVLLR
jgi:hypothetical protein